MRKFTELGDIKYEPDLDFDIAPDTGQWLSDSELNGDATIFDAIQDGVEGASAYVIETSAIEKMIAESSTFQGGPTITPEEAKKELNIEIDDVIPLKQAHYLSILKKDKELAAERFGRHLSLDTPINAAAGFIAFGALASYTPTALLLGAAVSSVASPIGGLIAAGAKGTVSAIRFSRVARVAAQLSKQIKRNKVYGSIAPGLSKAAQTVGKGLEKIVKSRIARAVTSKAAISAGIGNSLEEVGIHYIEATKGYKYDLAPVAAMGFFAPAVFKGLATAATGSLKGSLKIAKTVKTKVTGSVDNLPVKVEIEGKSKDLVEGYKTLDDVADIEEVPNKIREVFPEEDPQVKAAMAEVNGVIATRDLFGQEVFDDYMLEIAEGVRASGHKLAMTELFPFMKSPEALRDHLKVFKREKGLPMNTRDVDLRAHMDEIFAVKPGDLDAYHIKNAKDTTKPIKRNLDSEVEAIAPEKASDEFLETAKIADDEVSQALGRASDELDKAVDSFVDCIKGVVK